MEKSLRNSMRRKVGGMRPVPMPAQPIGYYQDERLPIAGAPFQEAILIFFGRSYL